MSFGHTGPAKVLQEPFIMKLSDIVVADAIIPELKAKTRDEAIVELVESLAGAGAIPKKSVKEIIKAIMTREAQATTGIGKGVALPHAKLKGIKKPIGTIGRSSEGIDFSALDSKPVYSVILLMSSPDNPDEHLQAMETIFKHVQRDIFRKFLRQSETKEAIVDLIREADEMA
jgi:mannitol/fructose-specific phosphotransferase system IIA component (Ntr-type)